MTQQTVLTEEGFRTIALEYELPTRVINWIWEGRPLEKDILEEPVRDMLAFHKALLPSTLALFEYEDFLESLILECGYAT